MEKHVWVTWLMFLQTAETLPQDEEEEEIAKGNDFLHSPLWFDEGDVN